MSDTNADSESKPEGKWALAALERNCYCGLWDKDPAHYEQQGLPLGHCGLCERCGVPGHKRHFPGPVPYTGAWCDRCYLITKWTWPFRSVVGWFFLLVFLGVAWSSWDPIIKVVTRALAKP